MDIDVNPYRELDARINPTEFEVFCMETLKAYAERENLQNFSIKHDQKIESDDGTYQIDVIAEYTALGAKNVVLRFQSEVEAFLPKHFMLEWDCVADYPYTQLYPTEEMEQEARNKARKRRINIE